MDENMKVGLKEEILADLTFELEGEPTFNSSKLEAKIASAIREVKIARKYPSSYTDDMIEKDLYNYYSNIRNIALYDYNKIGAEGETAHNENGVSRSYVDREKLFAGVIPLAKI